MASEIRANTLKNRVGLGTVSFTNTGPVVSGIVTANTIRLADDNKIQLGNDQDLQIYHDGSHTYIDNDTGNLIIKADGQGLKLLSEGNIILRDNDDSTNMVRAINGGQVELYHNGTKKLQTTNTGASVTGTLVATTFDGNVTGNISGGTVAGSTGAFSGDVSITDKIIHTDDTDTAFRFPASNTISLETAGAERIRFDSQGSVIINGTTSFGGGNTKLQVRGTSSAVSDGGQIFDIASTAAANGGTRLSFGVNEDNYTWIRSYESAVGGRDMVFAASAEKMRISSVGAKIGINTSTFDTNGSQIKIEGRGTGTTSPAFLQIKGVGNGALHSYVDLIATSDSNAGSAYRGLGVVMHDEPTNVEWFSGRPYAGSDKFIISRKASPSYRTESSEVANQLIRISSEGYVTKPYHPSFCARHQSGSGFSGDIIVLTRISTSWDVWNTGGHYSTSTGKFTAPVAGVYYFEGQLMTTGHSNGDNIQDMFSLESNRGKITYVRQRESYFSSSTNANGYYTNSCGSSVKLDVGDTVWIQRRSGHSWGYSNRYYSYFTGWLIG